MIQLKLPRLENIYWRKSGNRNVVKQLIEDATELDFDFISSHRSYSIIENNRNRYCLVCNKSNIPNGFDYVLLTDKKATKDKFESNEIRFKGWLKHPKSKTYTNDEIIESWTNDFSFIEEDSSINQKGLREPQIAALYSILSHLKVSKDVATVVMPTGTGKMETMLTTLVANKCEKILITVPSDALRSQIANKFYNFGLLKEFKIVGNKSLYPRVGVMQQNFESNADLIDFLSECNIVVTTMDILSSNANENLMSFAEKSSHIFIDEAHHTEANSWSRAHNFFRESNILQFTATPFRNDRKRLEGKIIFNFSLKRAQEQGYFKPINFIPIREYELKKGDKLIAQKAIEKLREDIRNGHNHILMARCQNKSRAEEIFKIYEEYEDLNPTLIHSTTPNKKATLEAIVKGEHKIIVAVNMLGEGFDLPQLKVAAFHDIRKSLPVTLQFAGRFTRTSKDEELGQATFIANLADANVEDELSELYAQDSDWNSLLSIFSSDEIDEQVDFNEFIRGFQHLDNSKIPFQNINFALSAVVYKNDIDFTGVRDISTTYELKKFKKGFQNYDDLEYKFHDYNTEAKTVVIITASKSDIDWVNYKEVFGLNWQLTILYYDEETDLLFIHSSDKSSLYKDLANAVLKGNATLINQLEVFKTFHDTKRVSLQNVGLKEFLNKKIRFTMRVGTDIEEALSIAEQQKGQKAFVFGTGYENGKKITLGCSYKGRIWSYMKSDLKTFTKWCNTIGKKLIDNNIDPNQILREILIPKILTERPRVFPTYIDWHEDVYLTTESKISTIIEGCEFPLTFCSINIINASDNGDIDFQIETPLSSAKFVLKLFTNEANGIADFSVSSTDNVKSQIKIGTRPYELLDFLNDYPPCIWFADGSSLQGNEHVELKQVISTYPIDRLISWNWAGVSLEQEAQGVEPIKTDSIQYRVINELKNADFDIIYDDDYSGEIADVITIKELDKEINVQFYHLKFAKEGAVNTRIDNFYEVCGQAQKSVHWKHMKGTDFFEHLLRRITKVENGNEKSRLEKGEKEDLERLLGTAKNKKPMNFEVFIVQPSLSKQNTSESIMTLLGVTENYLKEVGDINLKVIVNQ